jgi:hypothetical protein
LARTIPTTKRSDSRITSRRELLARPPRPARPGRRSFTPTPWKQDLSTAVTRSSNVRYLEPVNRPGRRSSLRRRLWILAAVLAALVLAGILARLF